LNPKATKCNCPRVARGTRIVIVREGFFSNDKMHKDTNIYVIFGKASPLGKAEIGQRTSIGLHILAVGAVAGSGKDSAHSEEDGYAHSLHYSVFSMFPNSVISENFAIAADVLAVILIRSKNRQCHLATIGQSKPLFSLRE
jgi:hypothetical protein